MQNRHLLYVGRCAIERHGMDGVLDGERNFLVTKLGQFWEILLDRQWVF